MSLQLMADFVLLTVDGFQKWENGGKGLGCSASEAQGWCCMTGKKLVTFNLLSSFGVRPSPNFLPSVLPLTVWFFSSYWHELGPLKTQTR